MTCKISLLITKIPIRANQFVIEAELCDKGLHRVDWRYDDENQCEPINEDLKKLNRIFYFQAISHFFI